MKTTTVPLTVKTLCTAVIAAALSLSPGIARAETEAPWAEAVVDISEQRVVILDTAGTVLRTWKISSGGPQTPTPLGTFKVTSKSRDTFAAGNPRVTMRHMTRFSGAIGFHSIPRLDGIALHTPLGMRPVSHGCIRLRDKNAKELFDKLPLGARVTVEP